MFRAGDIISATQLIKKFRVISRYFKLSPIPILVIQKNDNPLVLLPVDMFEDMISGKYHRGGETDFPPTLKDYLKI